MTPDREKFEEWAMQRSCPLGLSKGNEFASGYYADGYTNCAYDAWKAALSAAPTPPEVEPVAWMNKDGYITLFRQGDATIPLYTSPPSPKAEYDAEGNPLNLMAAAKDVEKLLSLAVSVKMPGHESANKYSRAMTALRKFIGEGL